jgi:hypothetical protein
VTPPARRFRDHPRRFTPEEVGAIAAATIALEQTLRRERESGIANDPREMRYLEVLKEMVPS